jgi:signal-transduction protein with cAMP-binding, CBS, and nucleotidyltransferase domain
MKKLLNSNQALLGKKLRQKCALRLLTEHLEEFQPRLAEKRIDFHFDIKRDLYRPIQKIIDALSLHYGVENTNILMRIQKLIEKGIFNPNEGSQLLKTVRNLLIWRVRAQLFYRSENEFFSYAPNPEKLKAAGLLTFNAEEFGSFMEIERMLIRLNKSVKAFVEGNTNNFYKTTFDDKTFELGQKR